MGHSLTRDCSAGLGSSSGAAESKMTENSNIEAAGMSASTQPSSPLSDVRKDRLAVWDHFDVENATEKKAKCKYCGSLIQYWNGTSSMCGHLRRCKQNPNNDSNKRETTTTPTIDERGALNSPSASKFDQEEAQRALVEMFIGEELPFRFVESPKFRRFVHALQATFKVPSQTTLARDIGALNAEEKMKLQDFLSANCGREQKSSGKDVHGTASKSNASAKGSAPPTPSSSSSKAGTSTAASGPVSEEEIRAVLKQKTRVTTQDLVAKFKARLRCKEDKDAFAEILKRICKIQRNPTSNRPSYVILRDK
ncbi:zinc finger BED domain-containing protein RICESLEEPER 1 isoform X1 [Arachis duranensis]|uniref:Transcription initiation factor IIF subunit alpha n=2 Tax=Arachis duranensis TaxID=130453 RepID=A0A9C6WSV2_ARADU|nr:zinc finger BED domain-containing protein RICESLEEPER 1 isoform X1 [Arachis duranensis]